VSVRPTLTLKYLYLIGGETGTAGTVGEGVTDSVERVLLNDNGALSATWTNVPARQGKLPSGISFAAAETVGQYIYLTGGHNGTAPQDSVLRSLVLNPLQVPRVSLQFKVDVNMPTLASIAPGLYSYRVSVISPAADTTVNPGGEYLASGVFNVVVPALPTGLPQGTTLQLAAQLSWTAVPGATYNVYRTTGANAALSTLRLHAVVSTNTFEDRGQNSTSSSSFRPLSIGDIGQWANVGSLQQARWGLSSAAAQQGDQYAAPPATVHILAMGGRSGSVVSSAVDRIAIARTVPATFIDPEQQAVTITTETALPGPRYLALRFVGTPDVFSTYTSNQKKAILYGGLSDVGQTLTVFETNQDFFVSPIVWLSYDSGNVAGGGFPQGGCSRPTQDQVFFFSGSTFETFGTGAADSSPQTAPLCTSADMICAAETPSSTGAPYQRVLPTSNGAFGNAIPGGLDGRVYPACVYASTTFYLIGGEDGGMLKPDVNFFPM
jgi:hypothetical protein